MNYLIAFHVYNFSYRGTETALYDYADKNETILKNKSFIVSPIGIDERNDINVILKFSNRFQIFLYHSFDHLKFILNDQTNYMYIIKSGSKDPLTNYFENIIPLLVHCVYKVNDPHGKVYAGVSEEVVGIKNVNTSDHKSNHSVNNKNDNDNKNNHNNNQPKNSSIIPFVPHMIIKNNQTNNLRKILNIPENAIVFGRHGGLDTFHLTFNSEENIITMDMINNKTKLVELLLKVLNDNQNIYFLFMPKPYILYKVNHPRIISLNISIDPLVKSSFINTCDAMIHCQNMGESQGISVLEFSSHNKPVITWNGGKMKQHLINLGDKAILYNTFEELYNLLVNFEVNKEENKDKENKEDRVGWDITEKFSDQNVMKKFNDVFLS